MVGKTHLLTKIFSATRDKMGVTEIGRKSLKEVGLAILGMGVTTASFQLA